MLWRGRGRVQQGTIVLTTPLDLPEGTEVLVLLEPVEVVPSSEPEPRFSELPFFGMHADLQDQAD